MTPIKTQQRYRCDFCKRTSIKSAMERHEKRCFRNPNRVCDYCNNKGYTVEEIVDHYDLKVDCPYCSRRNKEMEKEIAEYEAKIKSPEKVLEIATPF